MIELTIVTEQPIQAVDVTDMIESNVDFSDGFLWIAVPHTTAALILCESDEDMLRDIEQVAKGLFAQFEPFKHRKNDNPNAAAHLFSGVAGTQLVLPVDGGRLVLGTYQRILLVELDGPRSRRLQLAALLDRVPQGA